MATWTDGLSVKQIGRIERRVDEIGKAHAELLEAVRNRRPGDMYRGRTLPIDPDNAGTPGAWDGKPDRRGRRLPGIADAWRLARTYPLGLQPFTDGHGLLESALRQVDQLMQPAERSVRPIEYLRPPAPVRHYSIVDQSGEVIELEVVPRAELEVAA